jgi:hypothetical protein
MWGNATLEEALDIIIKDDPVIAANYDLENHYWISEDENS